jgi:hypothetical protein
MFQAGRTNANGSPVSREVQALDDIQAVQGQRHEFVDYNSPAAMIEFTPVEPMADIPLPELEEMPLDLP